MDYVSRASNPACGFTFGKTGDIAVVTEPVLDSCKYIYLFLKEKSAVLLRLPYNFTAVHPEDQVI